MAQTLNNTGTILLVKGLDTSLPAEYLDPQSSPNNQNMRSFQGLLSKREGATVIGAQVGGTDKDIQTGCEFDRDGSLYHVRISPEKVEKLVTGTWTDVTGTTLTGSVTDQFTVCTPLLGGKTTLVMTNGVDPIWKYTGTSSTSLLGGTPPKARYCIEFKTYLVLAWITDGGEDYSQRVQWSDTADIETWTGGNSGAVDLIEDGDDITGLDLFGDYLCVHKRNSIYLGRLVSSTSIFQFERVPTKVGTVSNASIKNLPTGEQVFLASDGIRVFNGVSANLIDSPINDEIRSQINPEYANKSFSVMVRERDEVWVFVPIGNATIPDTVYRFNYVTRTCYKDKRSNITAAWRYTQNGALTWNDIATSWDVQSRRWNDGDLAKSFPLISLSDSNGYTYRVDPTVQDDNAVAVDAFWDSKDFQEDKGQNISRWQLIQLWAKGQSVDVSYSIDGGLNWTFIKKVTLSDTFPAYDSPIYIYFDVLSSKIRFRFQNNTLGQTFSIKQFMVGYINREAR